MIFAGLSSSPNAVPEKWLYNCTRNPACQKPFYIPIIDFSDFVLYFDFPGKPSALTINIIPCDNTPIDISALFCNYVVAQKPDNSWYGIYTQLDSNAFPALTKFYIDATFTINGNDYRYFSNQFEFDACSPITKVEACYNDPSLGADAYDCNGIYYGYHAGTGVAVGNTLLRYFHHAYVRYAEVIENSNKMSFTLFNSQNVYRNFFTRLYSFQFELVPGFYKDVLIGIFNRGNIGIDGIEYTLSDAQDISITNDSLKWWKMDMKLSSLCRQWFSCTPTTCIPVPSVCINDFDTAVYVPLQDEVTEHMHLSGGILGSDESIVWQLFEGDTIIDSGVSDSVDIFFNVALDTETNCYAFKWDKNCSCGGTSGGGSLLAFRYGYSEIPFGDGTGGTVDKTTFAYQFSGVLTPGAALTTQFVGMPNNVFIAVEYPETESTKTAWYNTGLNNGTIPDFIMNPVVITGSKKYITSNIEITLDNSVTTVFS